MLLAKTPESTLFSDSDIIEKRSFGRSSYISCLLKIAKDPRVNVVIYASLHPLYSGEITFAKACVYLVEL